MNDKRDREPSTPIGNSETPGGGNSGNTISGNSGLTPAARRGMLRASGGRESPVSDHGSER